MKKLALRPVRAWNIPRELAVRALHGLRQIAAKHDAVAWANVIGNMRGELVPTALFDELQPLVPGGWAILS
jgi:hypothetical protein